MDIMNLMDVKDWLNLKFLEWEMDHGIRKPVSEFAAWLDIPQPVLSNYLNGNRKPTGENVHKLADKLGPEIYSLLGLENPDENVRFISRNWDKLPPRVQELLRSQIEKELKTLGNKGKTNMGRN